MIKKLIIKLFPLTVIIGAILIASNITGLNGFTIIERHNIEYNYTGGQLADFYWTYYTINLDQWLKNVKNALIDNNITGVYVELPTVPNPQFTDVLDAFKWLANWFVYWFNAVIYVINWVFLAPLKIVLYPINIVCAITGLNTGNNIWVNTTIAIYNWQIPFIPYIQ